MSSPWWFWSILINWVCLCVCVRLCMCVRVHHLPRRWAVAHCLTRSVNNMGTPVTGTDVGLLNNSNIFNKSNLLKICFISSHKNIRPRLKRASGWHWSYSGVFHLYSCGGQHWPYRVTGHHKKKQATEELSSTLLPRNWPLTTLPLTILYFVYNNTTGLVPFGFCCHLGMLNWVRCLVTKPSRHMSSVVAAVVEVSEPSVSWTRPVLLSDPAALFRSNFTYYDCN